MAKLTRALALSRAIDVLNYVNNHNLEIPNGSCSPFHRENGYEDKEVVKILTSMLESLNG